MTSGATAASEQLPTRYRFSVDEYERLAQVGILGEDDPIELIDGEIIQMSPVGYKHARCVDRLNRRLVVAVGDDAIVRIQNPIVIPEHSEPEPDVAVVRRSAEERAGNPLPEDVILLIEVSDTTLYFDRTVKIPLYARAGIEEIWIVDLATEEVTRLTAPTPEGYKITKAFGRKDVIDSVVAPTIRLRVSDVLPNGR